MISFTGALSLYQSLTNDNTTDNQTLFPTFYNNIYRRILGNKSWSFLEKSITATTVASQQFYNLPFDCEELANVFVTIGSTIYQPREIVGRKEWDLLNQATNVTSNFPEFFYVFNGQVGFYPTPSTTGSTITFIYKRQVKDLGIVDYTTGNIATATNGGAAVVGSGTTWTPAMAGRYLRIADSDTANKGDGFWYEISSSIAATAITLIRTYGGVSIAAGTAAYTIGQMPLLPEDYHILPVYGAVELYFRQQGETESASIYEAMYKEMLEQFKGDYGSKTSDPVVNDGGRYQMSNPNQFITYP